MTSRPSKAACAARALVVAAVGVFAATGAHASPGYPSEMQSYLSLNTLPQCTVCHTNNVGGIGTVTKDFGIALKARGLVLEDVASLHSAIDQLDADGVDSDGDGVTDVDELHGGTDPNVADASGGDAGPVALATAPVEYGFGCSAAAGAAPFFVLAFFLAPALVWRAGRRPAPPLRGARRAPPPCSGPPRRP